MHLSYKALTYHFVCVRVRTLAAVGIVQPVPLGHPAVSALLYPMLKGAKQPAPSPHRGWKWNPVGSGVECPPPLGSSLPSLGQLPWVPESRLQAGGPQGGLPLAPRPRVHQDHSDLQSTES